MQHLRGHGVSPGVAVGRALRLSRRTGGPRLQLGASEADAEATRLRAAVASAREQLEQIARRVAEMVGAEQAALFDGQRLMLGDPLLVGRAEELVRREHINAEWALERSHEEVRAVLGQTPDAYLKERQGDIADVVGRLKLNLSGTRGIGEILRDLEGPHVLVADEIPPSMAAQVDWTRVSGFISEAGSWTYHTAILARSLRIPGVVDLSNAVDRVPPAALVALDGTTGEVLLNPTPAALEELQARGGGRAPSRDVLADECPLPAVTGDGTPVILEANIQLPNEIVTARRAGVESVGLYRSERLLAGEGLQRLSEEAQYEVYRDLVAAAAPGRATIRTFDTTEEQVVPGAVTSPVPFGLQGIRLSLAHPELFRRQLRALLRAARHGQLRILLPFVSCVEEWRQARQLLSQVERGVRAGGQDVRAVPVGIMIELPSAALTADLLAREADFLSIGTNDLVQYCFAADRADDRLAHLHTPTSPAVLRLIRLVVRAARRRGIPVAMCGEMAATPHVLPLLVGLGVLEFSVSPIAIPGARQALSRVHVREARALAARALRCVTAHEVSDVLSDYWTLGHRHEPVMDG